jgi:hypothetical protein
MDAIEQAEALAALWPDDVITGVLRHQPRAWGHVSDRWYLVTVALAEREDETPIQTAERLAVYVQAYAERNGTPPSRASVAQ